jgi:hypothetical protein
MGNAYTPESVDVPGLGTLTHLSMAQMAGLHSEIAKQTIGFASAGLSEDMRATAASAIALEVAKMTDAEQAKAVCYSPFLRAMAAGMMSGRKEWASAPMLAARQIDTKFIDAIQDAIIASYGYGGKGDSANPPKAAIANPSPVDSQPSTSGPLPSSEV